MVLAKKDISAIWGRKGIRALLMILPVVLVMVIPVVYFTAISMLPIEEGAAAPEKLLKLLAFSDSSVGYRQVWLDAFTTLICPLLFLCVPIICSVASASCVFVGERETGTLETLFLSPLEPKSIFHVKITGCALLSIFISLLSFVLFSITVTVADLLTNTPYFFNLEWLAFLLFMMPAVSLFSVVFVSLVVGRVRSTGEALQTMGYLILPFALLFLAQFTGLFRLTFFHVILIAVGLCVLAVILFNRAARRFQPEKLLAEVWEGQNDY